MTDRGNTRRACERDCHGNFRLLHCRPPSLTRSMEITAGPARAAIRRLRVDM
ncbi:hypothetical protein BURMUCF1_A0163 [Burkholderia multivorans ATCC BAA-247]|nr:hypothetical protein BURMUCF1_A0163 [Burkholderia multivorans ATCC BAA-247]